MQRHHRLTLRKNCDARARMDRTASESILYLGCMCAACVSVASTARSASRLCTHLSQVEIDGRLVLPFRHVRCRQLHAARQRLSRCDAEAVVVAVHIEASEVAHDLGGAEGLAGAAPDLDLDVVDAGIHELPHDARTAR